MEQIILEDQCLEDMEMYIYQLHKEFILVKFVYFGHFNLLHFFGAV